MRRVGVLAPTEAPPRSPTSWRTTVIAAEARQHQEDAFTSSTDAHEELLADGSRMRGPHTGHAWPGRGLGHRASPAENEALWRTCWLMTMVSPPGRYIRHRPHDDLRRRRAGVRHGRASGQQAGHGRSFRQSRASLATTKVTPARASAATQMMTTRAAPMLAPMTSQMMNTTWRARTVHAKMWRFLRGRGGPLVSAPLYVIVETVGERQRRGRGTRLTMYADSYKMSQPVRICRAAPDELAEVRWLSLAEAHELLPSMFGR